jgi:hypothetical protein
MKSRIGKFPGQRENDDAQRVALVATNVHQQNNGLTGFVAVFHAEYAISVRKPSTNT